MQSGFAFSEAKGINDFGSVVGTSSATFGDRAFLFTNGTMTNIGNSGVPNLGGGGTSHETGISDIGDIVGFADATTGTRAFRWSSGTTLNLGSLPNGAEESATFAINNFGAIVGDSSVGADVHALRWQCGSDLDDLGCQAIQ